MIPGYLKISLAVTSGVALLFGEATVQPNDAYLHAKDLTVSGLLLAAVLFLYRELTREREKTASIQIETKAFVVAQSESIQRATDAQRVALEHVGTTLAALTTAASEQTETYRRHIDLVVRSSLNDRK